MSKIVSTVNAAETWKLLAENIFENEISTILNEFSGRMFGKVDDMIKLLKQESGDYHISKV